MLLASPVKALLGKEMLAVLDATLGLLITVAAGAVQVQQAMPPIVVYVVLAVLVSRLQSLGLLPPMLAAVVVATLTAETPERVA
jgi:hypothetical protein